MDEVTFITTYYNQPLMLRRHLQEWIQYPNEIKIILVDDGSPEPAEKIVREHAPQLLLQRLRLYRVTIDIPWARSTARNLGGFHAQTDWVIFTDLDHILPASCIKPLLEFEPEAGKWYLFNRNRRGKADATRKKDKLPRNAEYGRIHPHIDGFLIERSLFLRAPYDESYNNAIGGGSPFLARMKELGLQEILPDRICLEVHTRDSIPDASITGLSRDPTEYRRRKQEKEDAKDTNPYPLIRLPWVRVL